jgi:hypothetical protein
MDKAGTTAPLVIDAQAGLMQAAAGAPLREAADLPPCVGRPIVGATA